MADGENHGKSKGKRGTNPEFVANKWKKGQSGNPGGRRKGQSLSALIERELDRPIYKDAKKTKREKMAEVFVAEALNGNTAFAKLLLDRLWPVINQHTVEGTFDVSGARERLMATLERREAAEEAADRELIQ